MLYLPVNIGESENRQGRNNLISVHKCLHKQKATSRSTGEVASWRTGELCSCLVVKLKINSPIHKLINSPAIL
jgi:hypothetical protein